MLELNSGMMQELVMRQNPAVKAAAGVTHYYIYDPDRYAWADNLLDRGCKWDEEYGRWVAPQDSWSRSV